MLVVVCFALYVLTLQLKTHKQTKSNGNVGLTAKIIVDNMSLLRPLKLGSENFKLSPDIKINDENGKSLSFKELLNGRDFVLIYRFSENNCDLCIKQHIEILKELSSKMSLEKLILLSAYTNTKKSKFSDKYTNWILPYSMLWIILVSHWNKPIIHISLFWTRI